jgi:hypothetical protein
MFVNIKETHTVQYTVLSILSIDCANSPLHDHYDTYSNIWEEKQKKKKKKYTTIFLGNIGAAGE